MKILVSTLLLIIALLALSVGFSKDEKASFAYSVGSSKPAEDFGDTTHLAKTNPKVKELCDFVGSCEYITIECEKRDLKTVWWIKVPGANYPEPLHAMGLGRTLDDSIKDFIGKVRENRSELAWKAAHPTPETVIEPCDKDCK